jgi:hypothetical protein
MMLHSSSPSSTFLGLLAASVVGIPFVAAENNVTVEQLYGKLTSTAAPAPGFNAEGGSVFTNFADMVNNGQFFILLDYNLVFETPGSDTVRYIAFLWCSDLTFSDLNNNNSSLIGYAGRCVGRLLAGYDAALASGSQLAFDDSGEFTYTSGISGVFVEHLNVFEGQYHQDTDNWVARYWDDGTKTMPAIGWEGHDEGDMHPNAATSSWSGSGELTWMSVEEVAHLFNTTVHEFTPDTFKQAYFDTWIKDHEKEEEAAEKNPNAEAELAIIEQVKNETNYVDGTTSPAQPNSTAVEDGGSTDAANPAVEDDSAGGRQLASVAARFVSAALRVFGI